ncbi:electron transfer flavoprotein subunit beta/FixA family protein [Clostridium sp. JN-1]|uniref:electron transfer flavoprotein subunit beta/FixA family protein n=1 Tax=Clostridium sp. JN-1 TaxID=2483110 RepID=UPI000F0B1F75|nr:electron transfer flavoprotein subunit beta/FixA family protein [Clostridium sp. JN-1]
MKIIVCMKQVPNTNEVKINPKTGTLIREGIPSIINPDDKSALEEAIRIKEQKGGTVTVLTMGPPQADFALREALAMGADEAILLSDRIFAGADTWATSLALAKAIQKIENFDLIFTGRQAIDGDTAQVGPEIAEHLNLPQVTYVKKVISIDDDKVTVERVMEDGHEVIECKLPAVLTAVKELNDPRFPTACGIVDAFDVDKIAVWNGEFIGANTEEMGLKGSPTKVKRTFTPPIKGASKILGGTPKEAVSSLIQELCEKHIL